MEVKTHRPSGWLYLASISLAASLAGSAVAAAVVSMIEVDGLRAVPAAFLIFFAVGIWVAVPVGMAVGIPMLAGTHRLLPRHTLSVTVLFAISGMLGGLALQEASGGASRGVGSAFIVFGASVGGMHPLVCSRLRGGRWRGIVAALLLSGLVVPSAVFAGESVQNMIDSRKEFAALCADPYGSIAFVADRAALERPSRLSQAGQGKWYNQRRWRSLYKSERWIPLDEARMLIGRDYAYVPSGFAGWITGGRRVEGHCLSEKKGSAVALLRRHGFGRRPTLVDLED